MLVKEGPVNCRITIRVLSDAPGKNRPDAQPVEGVRNAYDSESVEGILSSETLPVRPRNLLP